MEGVPMIPLCSLSSLITVTYQHFACMLCMILLMILALWLVFEQSPQVPVNAEIRSRVGSFHVHFDQEIDQLIFFQSTVQSILSSQINGHCSSKNNKKNGIWHKTRGTSNTYNTATMIVYCLATSNTEIMLQMLIICLLITDRKSTRLNSSHAQ